MRSYALKAGLAAAVLSLSMAGGALAAGPNTAFDQDDFAWPVQAEAPRLEVVLSQLQSSTDGIKAEMLTRQASADQVKKLDSEVAKIRADAETVAHKNGGKIPLTQYHEMEQQVSKLSDQMAPSTGGGIVQEPNDG